jgi:hypothetical protein
MKVRKFFLFAAQLYEGGVDGRLIGGDDVVIFAQPARHAAGSAAEIQHARFGAEIKEIRPRRAIGCHRAQHARRSSAKLIFQRRTPAVLGSVLEECFRIIAAQRTGCLRAFKQQLRLRIRRAAADGVREENGRAVKIRQR